MPELCPTSYLLLYQIVRKEYKKYKSAHQARPEDINRVIKLYSEIIKARLLAFLMMRLGEFQKLN